MTIDEAARAFSELPAEGQVQFLARFGHNLTIAARDTYDFQAPTVRAPERLRAINEIQHRVLAHIHALLVHGEWRYADDVLVSILLEHDEEHLRRQAAWAFDDAMKKINVVGGIDQKASELLALTTGCPARHCVRACAARWQANHM